MIKTKQLISDAEFERQMKEAAKRPVTEPEARSAFYKDGLIHINLASGWNFSFTPSRLSEFDGASEAHLKKVGLWGRYTLSCEPLDVDISIGGIILELLGDRFINSEIGRRRGGITSEKKKTASRANGKLGGRPRKEAIDDYSLLKKQLEKARLNYKPDKVKYLLVAEAPPDNIERFFYYENVRQHDYLFLGVVEALYPDLKKEYLESNRDSKIKRSILLKLKADGFYLLDLAELPLSLLKSSLSSQLPSLLDRIKAISDSRTKIILIKTNVYDTAFHFLNREVRNVTDQRITFPGQGGQQKFQEEFKQTLKIVGYLK